MPEYQLVDLTADGSPLHAVATEPRIGIDTEFMRERTYFAKLCLVQVSTPTEVYCADPVGTGKTGRPNKSFWDFILQPEWVLHSGRQDLEVIYQAAGKLPEAVFDTQIAAALLGYQPQIGYGSLVNELFDVELAKSHTRADWSKRPISAALLEYAAEDVKFLLPAYDALVEKLDAAGRLEWAVQDSSDLLNAKLYKVDPDDAIHRLKGARNLRGRARTAAAGLAAWREQEAVRRNRPRQWIMRDPVLINMAIRAPDSKEILAAIEGMPEKTMRRVGDALLRVIADTTEDDGCYEPPTRPNEGQKAALKKMQQYVASVADDLGLATELIAPKKELSAAMFGDRDLRVFSGWRRDVIGHELLALLES